MQNCTSSPFFVLQKYAFNNNSSISSNHLLFLQRKSDTMAILRFRIYWEDDDLTYRDIEIQGSQTFWEFHKCIIQAFEFDGKHSASFYESNDKWQYGREFNSEVLVNKKDAPALSMVKTPVSALVSVPGQKFIYVYDPTKKWTFMIELTSVSKEETYKRTYPFILRREGVAPAQYGIKGVNPNKLMEIEEKYDLGAEEMAEGFGSLGADGVEEAAAEESGHEESGGEF